MASGNVNLAFDRQDSEMQLTKAEMRVMSDSDYGSVTSGPVPERFNSVEKKGDDEVFWEDDRDPESCGWCRFRPRWLQVRTSSILFNIMV